jgi:hypothetical protein
VSAVSRRRRPLCADLSTAAGEPLAGTASRVRHWLLVEYDGYWPYDPVDAAAFAGRVGERLRAALDAVPQSRLLLVKHPRRTERGAGFRIVVGGTSERGGRFARLALDRLDELADLDLAGLLRGDAADGEPLDHPLLLVCTHGKRDRCCARYGQRLCEALQRHAPPGWAWQSSHVGGDRFAGNVVALPEGLYYGRVAPDDVPTLLAAYREGRIDLDRYRGRSCHSFPEQAAELAVRRESGLDGFFDLRVAAVTRANEHDGWQVDIVAELAGVAYEVDVRVERGEQTFLTCHAGVRRRPRHFVAQVRAVVEA